MNKLLKLLLVLALPLAISAQEKLTLEEALEFGFENNTDFKNTQLDAAIRKQFAFEVMTEGFPQINLNLDYSFAFEQQVSIVPAGVFGPNELEFILLNPKLPI